MASGDLGAEALGVGLKTTHYVVKGLRYTPKLAKKTYKVGKGTVKGVGKGLRYTKNGVQRGWKYAKTAKKVVKKAGTKKAWKMYSARWNKSFRGKVTKAFRKAGNSVVTVLMDAVKSLGKKLILPLLLIVIVMMVIVNILNSASGAVGGVFSPFVSDDSGNEVDEMVWLSTHITTKRNALIQSVKTTCNNNLKTGGGEYDYVRFFNSFNDTELELTDTNISTSIYSVEEYQSCIEPIFHTILLSEYELQASEAEMQSILDKIWNKISAITTTELPMEYCHMAKTDNADGTYTIAPVKDKDDKVHADISVCPNHSEILYHEDNTANECCECDHYYYLCEGHKGTLVCGKEQHTHTDRKGSCYRLNCGKEEHLQCSYATCGYYTGNVCPKYHKHSDGCYVLQCSKEEHSHTEWTSPTDEGCYNTLYCGGHREMPAQGTCTNASHHLGCNGYYVCNGHKILALTVELKNYQELLDMYFLDEIARLENTASRTEEQNKRLEELKDNYEFCNSYLTMLAEEFGLGGGAIVDLDGVTLTEVTDYACSFVGKPYVWGGTDPNVGADCSGFVQYVYAHFGVSLPRTAHEQVTCGINVPSISEAQAGDLIFYTDTGTDAGVFHVVMYLGNNKIVHASNSLPYPSGGIKIGNVYGTIYKIKRIAQ